LSYLAGNKKKNAETFSFVNTVKEKKRTTHKSSSEILAEKRKANEEAKKKLEKEKEHKTKAPEPELKTTKPAVAPAVALAQPVITPKKDSVAQHNGGPRFKSVFLEPAEISDKELEEAHLARLEDHDENPTEVHTDAPDAHPNAERHEFVKRGGHQEELDLGDYVVVGVFSSSANAKRYADGLLKMNFNADYGHLTVKNLWYVYIVKTSDINEARAARDKYRQMKIFKDAWLLTTHE
jgi:hypothetical protein